MKISVIGCGRWGSFIAWYLDKIGHKVSLFGHETSKNLQKFKETGTNGIVTLRDEISLITDYSDALDAEIVVISVPSQSLREVCAEIKTYDPKGKIFVLCMKGIEISTGKRLSEVASEFLDEYNKIAIWVGPGHPQEFVRGVPNCMVIDSQNDTVKSFLIDEFSDSLIRLYYGNDLIGNEIGAATKNIIGIAAGMLDGLNYSSLKGPLIARAPREIVRLTLSLGGNEKSPYGLCHLGDYEATVFSKYSHNRAFGEAFVKGETFDALAEGYYTAEAVHKLSLKYELDMPICEAVYHILYEGIDPKIALNDLFSRSLKREFY